MVYKYFSSNIKIILKATKIYATILFERSITTMTYSNTGKNKGSKIQLPLKFVSLQHHLLGVNRIIHLNRLTENNMNVNNFTKMATKWFFKVRFYNKYL